MKKIVALILALVMITVVFSGCGEEVEITATNTQIAYITNGGDILDLSYDQAVYSGVIEYARSNNITYGYYIPTENTDAAKSAAIDEAIQKEAAIIVCWGEAFNSVIQEKRSAYPDLKFIIVDGDIENKDDNMAALSFRTQDAGFIAGYMTVLDGFTSLGFVGETEDEETTLYGYGFIQGAEQAAQELGVEVEMKYAYGSADYSGWYSSGTEVIFACGENIYTQAAAAAGADHFVITSGLNRITTVGNALTCAVIEYKNAIYSALDKNYSDAWGDIAGQTISYGAAEDCVSIPTDADLENFTYWRFRQVTRTDFADALLKLREGVYTVSGDTAAAPATTYVTVDYNA